MLLSVPGDNSSENIDTKKIILQTVHKKDSNQTILTKKNDNKIFPILYQLAGWFKLRVRKNVCYR